MVTDLGRAKSTTPSKYDAIVASQLKQAETRIRMLDLTAGLLGFAALILAFIVGMVLCDRQFLFSQQTRQLSLSIFVAVAAGYLYLVVLRPLWLRVNPYYAARQVEQQLPHAKNSIVNWVDLHEQPLPPAIRGSLGHRAAKDLSRVDLDRAISNRQIAWLGGVAGVFAVAFIASFLLLGPRPFLSLLKRTFNPFEQFGVSTRTRLTLLKPEGGDATVTVGRGINFAVEVGGKVPDPKAADAVKLLYRYEEGDPWLERRLIPETNVDWTASLSALEVKNGFWYKIRGGDAVTEEYRVGVRAALAITDFLATYRYRPYVARADEVRRERDLKALRGTEVLLRIHTNRTIRDGQIEFEAKDGPRRLKGVVDPNEPHTLLVHFVLDEDSRYRLFFTSTESEAYRDSTSYTIMVIPDQPPAVELTKPGRDISLPADALLQLEGKASDDIGVKGLVLQMRVIGGEKLRGQAYRSDAELRLSDGGYPTELDYKDFVELSRVHTENGQSYRLRGGMELEYWLEASDACDYPRANVAESKHYRVLLTEPEKNDTKANQEKKQAEQQKKKHGQKQDQKLQKENQERQQQRQEQEARNQEEHNKNQGANQGGKGEQSQQKDNPQGTGAENKDNNAQSGESKNGQGESNKGEQQSEQSKEDQSIEDRIKNALDRKEAGQDGKGEAKPDKGNSGDGKNGEQSNKRDGGEAGAKSTGANKGSGEQQAKQAGEGKDKGQQQAGGDPSQGDDKDDKSEPKGSTPQQSGKSGEGKAKPQPSSKSGEGKSSGDASAGKEAGQGKPQPSGRDQSSAKGDNKPGDDKGEPSTDGAGRKVETAKGSSAPQREKSSEGEAKPSSDRREGEKSAKGESKPDAGASQRNATAKEVQDLARALQSKDAGEREKAKRQLQQLAKEAADPKTREKAGEALEKLGEPDGRSGKETPKKDNGTSEKSSGEGKNGEKREGSKEAGSTEKQEGDGKDASGDRRNENGDKKGRGSSSREALPGDQASEQGNTPGGGGDRRSGRSGSSSSPPQQKQPNKPRDHRAAQMQLEDFARRVNKDILKDAGVSEEAWQKYLSGRRKQQREREQSRPESANAPQQANQLPSMGGRTIQSSTSAQDDAVGPARGQPPPGYRDSFREFTRQMSKKN